MGQFISVVFICFVLLFMAFLLVPIKVKIGFRYAPGDGRLSVSVRSFGALIYHKDLLPTVDYRSVDHKIYFRAIAQTTPQPEDHATAQNAFEMADTLTGIQQKMEWLQKEWQGHRELFAVILKHVHVQKLNWVTQLGLADAALTGLGTGGLWALKSRLLLSVAYFAHLDAAPQIMVVPRFDRWALATRLDCIVQLYLGDIMVVGILSAKKRHRGWVRARKTSH